MARGRHRPPRRIPSRTTAVLVGSLVGAGALMGYAGTHPDAVAASRPAAIAQDAVIPLLIPQHVTGKPVETHWTDTPAEPVIATRKPPAMIPPPPAHMVILILPNGTSYGCPRSGGTDFEPVYKCHTVKLIQH